MPKLTPTKTTFVIIAAIVLGVPLLGLLSSMTGEKSVKFSLRQNMGMGESSMAMPAMRPMAGNAASAPDVMMYTEEAKMVAPSMGGGMPASDTVSIFPAPPVYDEGFTPGVDRTIVKNASMSLIVDDTRAAVTRITDVVNAAQGAVTNTSVYEDDMNKGQVFANMTLRVPVDSLDSIMAAIRQVGTKVTSENITAMDRTEQKVDLDAQLSNLRATETQLLSIMNDASTVEETLKVQTELGNVRGQIERLEAQLQNLTGEAAYSTINVSLSNEESDLPITDPGNRSVWQEVKLAFRDAIQLYRNLFIAGLRLAIVFGPIALIIGLVVWVVKRFKK